MSLLRAVYRSEWFDPIVSMIALIIFIASVALLAIGFGAH